MVRFMANQTAQSHDRTLAKDERSSRRSLYRSCLGDLSTARTLIRCQVTRVYFAQMSDTEHTLLLANPEMCWVLCPRGRGFIRGKIEGCHSNVIGLTLLRQMLDRVGYDITDFWRKCLNTGALTDSLQPLTASTKIDGYLAPLHHDRESTLPTHFLRSDRVAVLRQN